QVEKRFTSDQSWGLGDHLVTSAGGAFRLRFAVAPADTDDLTPLEVDFMSVTVHDAGDNRSSRGEGTLTRILNSVTVLQLDEMKVRPGTTVPLDQPLRPYVVWLRPDEDLAVQVVATERDGRVENALGTAQLVHSAGTGWDLGVHTVSDIG